MFGTDHSKLGDDVRSGNLPSSHREVVRRLAAAQKPSKGAPAYSRYVNRPLGRQFAAIAFRLGLTPNQVTIISGICTFAGIGLLALVGPTFVLGSVLAALFVLGYALDAADGQLARLSGRSSYAGEWLDHMVDATKTVSLHLAVMISLARFTDLSGSAWLLVPICYAIVSSVLFFGMTLNDQLRRHHVLLTGVRAAPAGTSTLRSLLIIPVDYGFLCVIFVLLGATHWFFGIYTLMFVGSAAYLLLAAVKWFREFSRLDSGTQ
jgi:phosphatidylglycerophosphate synthase